jgi:hypothetical protein
VHALRHILTPGTPTYAVLKLGAVGSLFGLQYALRRRARDHQAAEPPAAESRSESRRGPHPRSKKKRRTRRRS